MTRKSFIAAITGVALAAGMLQPSGAAERGGLNLGITSFFDGFGPTTPGCSFVQYVGYDTFNVLNGPDGNAIADDKLKAAYVAPQIACASSATLFGATVSGAVVVPVLWQDAGPYPRLTDNDTGIGDIVVTPILQFKPVVRDGRDVYSQGLQMDLMAPNGKFNAARSVNPGNDYWSIGPTWRATLLPLPHWEISWRTNYIHNFDHSPGGINKRTGDGVWMNFTTSYEIFKDFYLGMNGYWLKQLEADEANGEKVPNSKQESLYLGPGLHYTFASKDIINANVYLPVEDINAFSNGVQANIMYVHPF